MTAVTACRSCGGTDLQRFLDLGTTPLPDALVDPGADLSQEERFPLGVAFCPSCSLVQLTEEVSAEKMFVDNYHYYSSFSDHLLKHSRRARPRPRAVGGVGPIWPRRGGGQHDGYLLRNFVESASRCSASTRRPARRPPRSPPACRRCGSSSASTSPGDWSPREAGRRHHRQQRHGPRARPQRVRGRHKHLLADDGLITVENPRPRPDRPLRVRHHLPRALLLLLVHGGRRARPPAQALAQRRRVLPPTCTAAPSAGTSATTTAAPTPSAPTCARRPSGA